MIAVDASLCLSIYRSKGEKQKVVVDEVVGGDEVPHKTQVVRSWLRNPTEMPSLEL
jgi:AAA+ superfamily predicted ATPase